MAMISASASRRAHRVGVALHELPEPPRPRLLVAPHRPKGIAAERLGQGFPVLRREAGERSRQVIPQRHPLLVVVLQGEHALVRPVRVGQELAQRIGVLERRRLQGLEAIALVHRRHGGEDLPLGHQVAGATVDEASRAAGLGTGSVGHGAALSGCRAGAQGRVVVHIHRSVLERVDGRSWKRAPSASAGLGGSCA
jgi:hypothetical protein